MSKTIQVGQILQINGASNGWEEDVDLNWDRLGVIVKVDEKEYVTLTLEDLEIRRFSKRNYNHFSPTKSQTHFGQYSFTTLRCVNLRHIKNHHFYQSSGEKKAKKVQTYFKKNTLRNIKSNILSPVKLKNLLKQARVSEKLINKA